MEVVEAKPHSINTKSRKMVAIDFTASIYKFMYVNEILWECEIRRADLRFSCPACDFVTDAAVGDVASRYGPRLSLIELESHLCCPHCGGEGMAVNPIHPYHRPPPGAAQRLAPVRPRPVALSPPVGGTPA